MPAAPETSLRPGVFLDLNGTLVLPLKQETLAELREIDGAVEGVALLCRAGFVCPVVTVQSRIEKGLFSEEQFRAWFESFRRELARGQAFLEGPYICPHRFAAPCGCKKRTGALYRTAANDHGIDLRASFVVGDSDDDMEAARLLGCRGVLVRTGWRVDPAVARGASHVADDVLRACRWILTVARNDSPLGAAPVTRRD